jgi:molybdopterin converting factor small subunit
VNTLAEVWIPTRLQTKTDGQKQVQVEGTTVRQIIANLDSQYPGIEEHLCRDGDIAPGLAVIVDGDASPLGVLTRVQENSEIHFLPSIEGG